MINFMKSHIFVSMHNRYFEFIYYNMFIYLHSWKIFGFFKAQQWQSIKHQLPSKLTISSFFFLLLTIAIKAIILTKAISSIMWYIISNKPWPAGLIMKPLVMIKIIMYDSHTGKCKDETNKLNYFRFILWFL